MTNSFQYKKAPVFALFGSNRVLFLLLIKTTFALNTQILKNLSIIKLIR